MTRALALLGLLAVAGCATEPHHPHAYPSPRYVYVPVPIYAPPPRVIYAPPPRVVYAPTYRPRLYYPIHRHR
jgi:hypothetical protein